MNTIKKLFAFFFSFNGRISRLHYTLFLLLFIVITLFLNGFITLITISLSKTSYYHINISFLITYIITAIIILAIKYSHITRRIHDFNKSTSESKLFTLIIISEIASIIFMFVNSEFKLLLSLISNLSGLISIILLSFFKGTDGENKFGLKPIPFWKNNMKNKE